MKFQGKSAFRTLGKKAPKIQKSKATIPQKKKKQGNLPKKISQRPKKAKIKDKITQKAKFHGKNGYQKAEKEV